MDKPFYEACARNQGPILEALRAHYGSVRSVFEVGSRNAQHAVRFAAAMPWLRWQCSDLAEHLPAMQAWIGEAALPNLPAPIVWSVDDPPPPGPYDAVFTANTLHIVSWPQVVRLFAAADRLLAPNGWFSTYGAFNIGGRFTSPSNAAFDRDLRAADPQRGIRDFEAVDALARGIGLALVEDRAMPANNRCINWRRGAVG
jgi:hypothetical protein